MLCNEVRNYAAKTSHSSFIWAICENYDIFMGYSRSTYWTKRILTRQREIFLKVEPYLTFLNIPQLGDRSWYTIGTAAKWKIMPCRNYQINLWLWQQECARLRGKHGCDSRLVLRSIVIDEYAALYCHIIISPLYLVVSIILFLFLFLSLSLPLLLDGVRLSCIPQQGQNIPL